MLLPLPQLDTEADILSAKGERASEEDGVRMDLKPGYKQTEVGLLPAGLGCYANWVHEQQK